MTVVEEEKSEGKTVLEEEKANGKKTEKAEVK
jgi:hypothetical protein